MNILWLVVKTLGSLLVVACLLRAYLQVVRLHAQNPISRLTFQMTDWAVLPLRRLLPGFGGFDWASALAGLLIALVLAVIFYFLMGVGLFSDGQVLEKPVRPFGWIVALAALWMVSWSLQLGVVLLIVSVALSWLNPLHPLKPVFDLLVSPMLLPFQRLMGRGPGKRAGIDLSPIGAFLTLQIASAVVAEMESAVIRHLL
jgi:YggT family protein